MTRRGKQQERLVAHWAPIILCSTRSLYSPSGIVAGGIASFVDLRLVRTGNHLLQQTCFFTFQGPLQGSRRILPHSHSDHPPLWRFAALRPTPNLLCHPHLFQKTPGPHDGSHSLRLPSQASQGLPFSSIHRDRPQQPSQQSQHNSRAWPPTRPTSSASSQQEGLFTCLPHPSRPQPLTQARPLARHSF